MCEEWWDERLLREQAERLKRSTNAPAPKPDSEKQDRPEGRPERQPDPVPV
jgi:hypothetical protein